MYKLCFHVPESHVEMVKAAVFEAGAGQYNNYSHCAWQVLGQGQFKPMANSNPFIGKKEQLNKVPEYYVEMLCLPEWIHKAVASLKQAHPYEEPSYMVIKLEDF